MRSPPIHCPSQGAADWGESNRDSEFAIVERDEGVECAAQNVKCHNYGTEPVRLAQFSFVRHHNLISPRRAAEAKPRCEPDQKTLGLVVAGAARLSATG